MMSPVFKRNHKECTAQLKEPILVMCHPMESQTTGEGPSVEGFSFP